MIRTTTKRSMLFVLLVSNSVNPLLLALPQKPHPVVKNNRQALRISNEIKNILLNKGLDKEVAVSKVNKLFKNNRGKTNKLLDLCNNPEFSISKKNLNSTLSKYALHEKQLNLNSYSSLIGLVQSTKLQSLNKKQLDYISQITSIA